MFNQSDVTFTIVLNPEEQYSIWPTSKSIPPGWYAIGFEGTKEVCLDEISKLWKDMRPKSLKESGR